MNAPFYLRVTTTGFEIVQGRLSAAQLRAGKVQHYPNGVTVHYAQGAYLVHCQNAYRRARTLARAHRFAMFGSALAGVPDAPSTESRVHGVAPCTPAQRLADAWNQK